MTLATFLRLMRRQLVLIVAATFIGLSAGALTAMNTPQRYEASTDVLLSVQLSPDATPGERNSASNYIVQASESYRQLIGTSLVLSPVIESLGLDTSPSALADRVRASASPRSAVITITVVSRNPGQAARIANAVADSFRTVVTETLERRDVETAYTVRVMQIQQAQVPTTAVAPDMRLSLALGAVLGLGAGIGVALLRATLDTRIRTVDDLQRALDAPVLGKIAHDPDAPTRPLIVATAPHDPRSEAFRTLRTNVRFLFPSEGGARFVITSAGPGEGKTTTAANLAISFAEAGYRTLIVDADMRLPRIADTFGIEGAIGLSDVLVGRIGAEDALQRWGRGTLFVLPAGTTPPNPAELLGSTAMETLLGELSLAFDVVIVDAPPLLLVTDAALLARSTTGVLLVAAAGSTTRPRLTDAAASISAVGARVLGTVATMLPARGADRAAHGTRAVTGA